MLKIKEIRQIWEILSLHINVIRSANWKRENIKIVISSSDPNVQYTDHCVNVAKVPMVSILTMLKSCLKICVFIKKINWGPGNYKISEKFLSLRLKKKMNLNFSINKQCFLEFLYISVQKRLITNCNYLKYRNK